MPKTQPEIQIDFGSLFENDLDACVIVDSAGLVVRTNLSFPRLFGWEEAEARGRNLDELIVPKEQRAEAEMFTKRTRELGELSLETVRCRKDGSLVSVWVVGLAHYTEGGQGIMYVQYRDVTRQKVAEEALRSSEAQLRAIFEQAPLGIAMVDPELRIIRHNRALAELIGPPDTDIRGVSVADLAHPSERPSVKLMRDAVLNGSIEAAQVERRWSHQDGHTIWVRVAYSLIRTAAGEPSHFLAVVEDITELRAVTERREAALEHFELLIENLRDGILVLTPDARITAMNQAFKDIFDITLSADRLIGTDLSAELENEAKLTDDPGEYVRSSRQRIAAQVPACDTIRFSDGRVFDRDYRPIRNSAGVLTGHMFDLHELTETLRLQEQLRQSQKMEAVGRLAGGIAHDFNNLLTVLQGHASMLLEDVALPPSARDDVVEILKASNKAANLTRQLLAYSRQQVLKPSILDLGDVVQDLERMLLRMIREDIALKVEIEPDTPRVRADRTQVEQVILNLAVNARDAMPAGGELCISIKRCVVTHERIERDFTLPPNVYALLCVRDSGEGIEERTLPRIFDPFFTTKEQGKGTGLGLATVYGIVKQSGGYIHVKSARAAGTAFEIYLPEAEGA